MANQVGNLDPATRYARAVISRKQVACEHIQQACKRHMLDLDSGLHLWRPELGRRFERFCQALCVVENPLNGQLEPFQLLPWQQFFVYSLLGWLVRKDDPMERDCGSRRYRRALLLTGKGSGKSPLCSALALYIITSDGWYPDCGSRWVPLRHQSGVVCASTQSQAREVGMLSLQRMIDVSPVLRQQLGVRGIGGVPPLRIVCGKTSSYIQTAGVHYVGVGKAGLRPSLVVWEEMHECIDRAGVDLLISGAKGHIQPLLLMPTNAGKEPAGIAYDEYRIGQQAARGVGPDSYLSLVYQSDEADLRANKRRWYPHQKTWQKANPSLGVVIRSHYIRDQVDNAKTDSAKAAVLRLNFGRWVDPVGLLFPISDFIRCATSKPFPDDVWDGHEIYMGVDLSRSRDMTSLAVVGVKGQQVVAKVHYWTPRDTLMKRDMMCSGRILEWAQGGYITTCPGTMIDFSDVAGVVKNYWKRYDVVGVAMDPYAWESFYRAMVEQDVDIWSMQKNRAQACNSDISDGIEMVDHSQALGNTREVGALGMEKSIQALERLIYAPRKPRIKWEHNPVLNWNLVSSVIVHDPQGNRRFAKAHSLHHNHGMIDGLVALVMAVGMANRGRLQQPDYFDLAERQQRMNVK